MKTEVNLPQQITVRDYHEFQHLQNVMRKIIPGIKIKEVGFYGGEYHGVAYVGTLHDKKCQMIVDGIKHNEKAEDEYRGFY